MRILFVCSTEYQIFNMINMKLRLFKDQKADAVIQCNKNNIFAERLRETGLFEHVCYVNREDNLHDYVRKFREHKETGSFLCAVKKSLQYTAAKLSTKFFDAKAMLKHLVYDLEQLPLDQYTLMLAQSNNDTVNYFYDHLSKNNCKVGILEEGIGSYYIKWIGRKNTKADIAYLYCPWIASYYEEADVEFVTVPAADKQSGSFMDIINRVFDFEPETNIRISDSVIFFDQGGERMPIYLKNCSRLVKLLFHNSYKRHLRENDLYMEQIEIFKKIADKYSNIASYIKFHPRTPKEMLLEYNEDNSNIKVMQQYGVPWEVFCCNGRFDNNVYVTVDSSSVLLPLVSIENNVHNRCIFLFELLHLSYSKDIIEMFYRAKKKLPEMVFIPKTFDELCLCINEYVNEK